MFHPRRRSKLGIVSAVCGRLWLALALWHAPLPVIHAHTLSIDRVSEDNRLAEHLLDFHRESLALADRVTDWHWHCILPTCEGKCGDQDHHLPASPQAPVWKYAVDASERHSLEQHSLASFQECFLNLLATTDLPPVPPCQVAHLPSLPAGYAQSPSACAELPLLELLSRRVC